jgi:hypothetical protein|tara:strand:- start:1331 stop:1900 length:570 start_codon:yes stop_codon:yes gene_type:complete
VAQCFLLIDNTIIRGVLVKLCLLPSSPKFFPELNSRKAQKDREVLLKKLSALHHISIIESRGTNCAWVRIKYNNKSFQQSFPFKKFGGKNKAIAAAKKKRDAEGKKIYGKNWPYAKFSPRKISPLNSSGEIGVSYSEKDHSWVATWQEGKGVRRKQKNSYFSINKYGEAKAMKMAVKARRDAVKANQIQ